MDRQYSMDADDLPLIMELFGDGGELDALVVDQQQQPQQQQPSEASSHAVPEMGGRRPSEDASAAHAHAAQYQQLAALQQQLQILQGMVQQQMQSLSHAQPDGMRETLLTMQGLLSTTQQQQAAQQQQLQQLQQFQHQQQHHHQHHQQQQQHHQNQHQQEQQQQQQPLGAAPAHAHSQPLMPDFSQAPGVIPHGYSAPELSRPPSTVATAAEQPQQQPQAQRQPQPPPPPLQPGIKGNPAKPGQDQQQHEKRRSGPEPSSKPARQKPQRKAQLMELQRQLQAKQAEAHELLRKNSDLKRRQRVLGMVIQVREEQMRRLNILRTKPQELESNYGSFVQASRNPWTNSLSVEQLKNMNAAVAADMFAKYIQELSRLMGQMSQGSEAEVALALGGGASSSSSGGRAQGSGSSGGNGRSQGRSQHASVITTQALAASSGTGSTAAAAGGTAAAAATGGAGVTGGTPGDGGTAPSDPCAQMEELINEVREVTRYMQLVNPQYQAVLYDNGALVPPPGHWAQVLEAASLRDEQIADFLVLREIHNSLTAKVYRDRRHLASQLQDALAVQLSSPATAELSAVTVARGKTTMAMERLHRNVLKERCLMFLTGETFYNAFDSDQLARLCLACYPHKPDEIALWDELARQQQLEG